MLHHHSSQPTTPGGPRHHRNQTKSDSPGGASNASSGSSNSTKSTNCSTGTTFLDTHNDPKDTSNDEFTSSTTTTPIASTNSPSMANAATNGTTTATRTTTNFHHGNYGGIINPSLSSSTNNVHDIANSSSNSRNRDTRTPTAQVGVQWTVCKALWEKCGACCTSFRTWIHTSFGKLTMAALGLVFSVCFAFSFFRIDLGSPNFPVVVAYFTWVIEDHVLNIKKNPSSLLAFRIECVFMFSIVIGAIIYVGQVTAAPEMIGIAIAIPAMYTAFSLFVIESKRCFRIFYSGNENEDPRQEQGLPSNDEHATIRGPPPARMHHGDGIPSQGTAIGWMYFCNAIAWLFVALRAFWLEGYGCPFFVPSLHATLFFIVSGVLSRHYFSRREQTEEIYYKVLSSLACFLVLPFIRFVTLSVKIGSSDSGKDNKSQEAHTNEEAVAENISIFLFSFPILVFVYGILVCIDKKRVSGLSPYAAIRDRQMV